MSGNCQTSVGVGNVSDTATLWTFISTTLYMHYFSILFYLIVVFQTKILSFACKCKRLSAMIFSGLKLLMTFLHLLFFWYVENYHYAYCIINFMFMAFVCFTILWIYIELSDIIIFALYWVLTDYGFKF